MLRPSPRSTRATLGRRRSWGFTLLELMMVVAIVAILATLAVSTYRVYILKAEAVQALVNYGHLRTVISVKTYADQMTNLQENSAPGAVPPALIGSMAAQEFNGPDGVTFQLIRAPAGTFASYPSEDTYALVATANNPAAVLRLRVLRTVLPQADGDKIWVLASADASSAQLIYPVEVGPGGALQDAVGTSDEGSTVSDTSAISGGSTSVSAGSNSGATTGSTGTSTGSVGTGGTSTGSNSSPAGATSSASSGTSLGSGTSGSGSQTANTNNPTSPAAGSSTITGSGAINGNTWTASAQICPASTSGGPLTGQTNTSVIFQVVTQYASFQVNQAISPTTGCTSYSYGGLPLSSDAQISVVQVVDYNPPNSGGTSTLWDGAKPTLTITP
ncbi:type IV pilin protein [Rhodanobacter sp. Si-c]|uniref:Type IV pilin protein n=1 Tax=Rhodanobacter lycopersici TaxID=3162487 RepID=A0ABV3QEI3_9GAMM